MTQNLENFELPTEIFCSFSTICQKVEEKVVCEKNGGHQPFKEGFIEREVNVTATSPMLHVYDLRQILSSCVLDA